MECWTNGAQTIDLVAPMRHGANAIDRIRNILRSPSPPSNDVVIDLRPFISNTPIYMEESTLASLG